MQSENSTGYHSEAGYHRTQRRRYGHRQIQVLKVNTVNCTGHTKRMGRNEGKRPDFKKAVITINPEPTADKDGKKRKGTIEFFDGMF